MQQETSTKVLIKSSMLSQCSSEIITNCHNCVPKPQSSVFIKETTNKSPIKSRSPLCALCRNHGKMVRNKGHKWRCPWKDCSCRNCVFTKYYRKFKASEIAGRRALIEKRKREMLNEKLGAADTDNDIKVFSEERCSSTTKSPEEDIQKQYETKESFESASKSGAAAESPLLHQHWFSPHGQVYNAQATVVGNFSPIFTSCGCFPTSQSKRDVGFRGINPTQPEFRVREAFQSLNTMFHPSHEIRYPIRVLWNGFRRDFDSAASRTLEGSDPARFAEREFREHHRKLMEHVRITVSTPFGPVPSFHSWNPEDHGYFYRYN